MVAIMTTSLPTGAITWLGETVKPGSVVKMAVPAGTGAAAPAAGGATVGGTNGPGAATTGAGWPGQTKKWSPDGSIRGMLAQPDPMSAQSDHIYSQSVILGRSRLMVASISGGYPRGKTLPLHGKSTTPFWQNGDFSPHRTLPKSNAPAQTAQSG
jgi:hypothetical protein